MRLGLVIGDGINHSLRATFPSQLNEWSTSNPLRWPASSGDEFHGFGRAFSDAKVADFELIARALGNSTPSAENLSLRLYIMRRLLRGFSAYQMVVDTLPLAEWEWGKWSRDNNGAIEFVVSLNYDIVWETMLSSVDIRYHRIGTTEAKNGVAVAKPHGSIDFSFPEESAKELIEWAQLNCVPLVEACCNIYDVVDLKREAALRLNCDLVLPTESNHIDGYGFSRPSLDHLSGAYGTIDALLLIGLSYWSVDRPELDDIIDRVNPDAKIIMVNPRPSREWLSKLDSQRRRVESFEAPPRL